MQSTDRKGFALPAAIGGLVIVGLLVTSGFYIARQEVRIGVASKHSSMAVNIAQTGVNEVLVRRSSALAALPNWGDTTLTDSTDHGTWSVNATRLNQRLFFLNSTAEVTEGGALWAGANRSIGLVARITTAEINPPAALTTTGSLKYGGSAMVHGIDEDPNMSEGGAADWTGICPAGPLGSKPGILIDDTLQIDWNGNESKIKDNMSGTPIYDQDPTMTPASLMDFGEMGWTDLVSIADKVYYTAPSDPAPALAGGECDASVKDNWGDPVDSSSPCFNYFPIIYLGAGSQSLTGGYGQGILLVEGDLKVTGGFEFYGPVFINGTLETMGAGGHFWGGVVAANVNLAQNTVLGNAVITYSSCAVDRAILNNSALTKVRPLAMRSWMDLSGMLN